LLEQNSSQDGSDLDPLKENGTYYALRGIGPDDPLQTPWGAQDLSVIKLESTMLPSFFISS
jgi:hypothetical protein